MDKIDKVHVVEDPFEKFPSFQNMFYCSLDYQLVTIYIMLFFFFEEVIGFNSLLSLFFVYLVERGFFYLRKEWGEENLSKKSYIDKSFFS